MSRSEAPLRPGRTNAFKRDLERCKRRGYDMDTARVVMGRLIHRETLDPVHNDHSLKGQWAGHRECHLRPDWLLIYRAEGGEITFERMGTHADLFDE